MNQKKMTRLRYVSTDEPGYTRKKWGRGFTYLDTEGETIRDPELRAWIESIVIPPAWTNVWISPYKNGHILATGRDDKGRKQYCYHPEWRKRRDQKKFDQLYEFGQALPRLRAVTETHLSQRTVSRTRVLAAIVRLLENTLIRIGNEEYARHNNSYGLSTLTDDHVEVNGSQIIFDFVGKSGKEHTVMLHDQRLARIVRRCQDLPGYDLFQYTDEDGAYHRIESADVNAYLQDVTGQPFTAKVFRTWGGSCLAVEYLCTRADPEADPEAQQRASVKYVADLLGNTLAVTRQYYIHPLINEAHLDSTLCALYSDMQKSQSRNQALTSEELTLMALIEQAQT